MGERIKIVLRGFSFESQDIFRKFSEIFPGFCPSVQIQVYYPNEATFDFFQILQTLSPVSDPNIQFCTI
jgi:hypothetical protein